MRSRKLTLLTLAILSLTVIAAVSAQAQTYTVLYAIPNQASDLNGINAYAIAQGRNGDLYTTSPNVNYGLPQYGELISATTSGVLTPLYNVGGSSISGATLGTDGNLYGTTPDGGTDGECDTFYACGTIYKVTPAGVQTVLHIFDGTDGQDPYPALVQASNGLFYGVAEYSTGAYGTIFSISSSGTFALLHTFEGSDGEYPTGGLTVGSDGNFYGGTTAGGTNGAGVLFKITPGGTYTVLHNFCSETNCADGQDLNTPLTLAGDGNLYGMTARGSSYGALNGMIFRLTNSGTYTVIHGETPPWQIGAGLTLGTDGNLYGVFSDTGDGSGNYGNIFKVTTSGVVTILHTFCQETNCADGEYPSTPLIQDTNGTFYGFTLNGGVSDQCGFGCGVFYSLDMGLKPFVKLLSTSGKVGSAVQILGQGFTKSSVVKFNGVASTAVTFSESTFLTATVPAGATDGYVTVTTGTTTLTSAQKYIVHNSWASGKAMPTATARSSAATLGGEIYVIGGANASGTVLTEVQIYSPITNAWSSGTALPAAIQNSSAAVVNNILYVFGGDNGVATPTNTVWAYNPKTKTWTSMAAMPTARNGTLAVVEGGKIYVMGGNLGGGPNFVATVESYNPATNTWATEASMDGVKDFPAGGLIGTTIVAADGATDSAVTGDTEGYDATTNSWSELTADPTARTGPCSGVIGGILYDASGYIGNAGAATTVNESFGLPAKKWTTTLLPIPQGTMYPGAVVANGQLYCFGGSATWNGAAISNVQIYQP